jgi:hypothetical protein
MTQIPAEVSNHKHPGEKDCAGVLRGSARPQMPLRLCVPETYSQVDVGVQVQEVVAAEQTCTDISVNLEQACNIYVRVNVGRHQSGVMIIAGLVGRITDWRGTWITHRRRVWLVIRLAIIARRRTGFLAVIIRSIIIMLMIVLITTITGLRMVVS